MIVIEQLRSLAARLALATGDLDTATAWIDAVGTNPALTGPLDLENPRLTRARVLLAHDTKTSLEEAASVLEQALERAKARHDLSATIEALALWALVERARGDTTSALTMLGRALALAEPGRFVRTFTDHGPPLAGMLVELTSRSGPGLARTGADRLLRAFRHDAGESAPALPSRIVASADLVEPLTWRELEILQLIDGQFTNKEIAQALCISAETVKRHAYNLYQKLQVGNVARRSPARACWACFLRTAGDRRSSLWAARSGQVTARLHAGDLPLPSRSGLIARCTVGIGDGSGVGGAPGHGRRPAP